MKTKCSIFICICLLCTIFTTTTIAYASDMKVDKNQTRFSYIDSFENTFNISSKGKATVTSYLIAQNGDNLKVVTKLQQYKNGYWKTIKSWSKKKKAISCGVNGTWYVRKGDRYRMVSYGYTYKDGKMVESTTYTSKIKEY